MVSYNIIEIQIFEILFALITSQLVIIARLEKRFICRELNCFFRVKDKVLDALESIYLVNKVI